MNTGTLIASLVMAGLVVVVIAVCIGAMLRGWRRRALRQAELIGALPPLPDVVGETLVAPTRGLYVGSTLATTADASPSWLDRVAVGDLGFRAKAVMTRYPEGIMLQRSGAAPIWMPAESITAIRAERGLAGKVLTHDGILAIRWRLPSGTEIDTGFRGDDNTHYEQWLGKGTQ